MLGTDRPRTIEALETTVWDDATGETWAQALIRFRSFGPTIGAAEAAALPAGSTVWSFGYGEEPDAFTTMDVEELTETIAESGVEVADDIWGPFVVHQRGDVAQAVAEYTAVVEAQGDTNEVVDLPAPVQLADIIADTIATNHGGSSYEQAERILAALVDAGCQLLAPQDLIWGECPESYTGRHNVSVTLCDGCLQYDPD